MSSIEKAIERLAKSKAANTKRGTEGSGNGAGQAPRPPATGKPPAAPGTLATSPAQGQAPLPAESPSQKRGNATSLPNAQITLDYKTLAALGYVVPDTEYKQLAEEYRIIKRPVLLNAFGKGAAPIEHGNLVSVTSSLPAEGKTFTALNLGLSIASEMDVTVLLIDGDVIKASLSQLLGVQSNRGLNDLLDDPACSVGDVILDTQNPKLKIIPAGSRSAKSTELLASQAMERLLTELAERYSDRIILFDSPPMLATSEASVLNHLMGQVLVVVEAGNTPVDAIKDALSRLEEDKAIGLILNKSRDSKTGSYLGTYY